MEIEDITETTHDEFLTLLVPVIEFMHKHKYSYFLVAGKDDLCSQYVGGNAADISGMLESLFIKHPNIKEAVKSVIEEI